MKRRHHLYMLSVFPIVFFLDTTYDDPDHARHAVRAAIEIEALCRERTFAGVALPTRIGINTFH